MTLNGCFTVNFLQIKDGRITLKYKRLADITLLNMSLKMSETNRIVNVHRNLVD